MKHDYMRGVLAQARAELQHPGTLCQGLQMRDKHRHLSPNGTDLGVAVHQADACCGDLSDVGDMGGDDMIWKQLHPCLSSNTSMSLIVS